MQNIHINLDFKKLRYLDLIALLLSLSFINYILLYNSITGTIGLIIFIVLFLILLKVNPVCAFVYCFVLHADIMTCFNFGWAKLLTIVGMYSVFLKDSNSISSLFNNKKLKTLFTISVLFSIYVIIINIGLKANLTSENILKNAGYAFGFLIFLPAYYFTLTQPKLLFVSLVTVAGLFVFIYYFSLLKGLDIFKLENSERHTGATVDRMAGYDIRQFVIFFTYLIPAALLTDKIKNSHKYLLLSIGILSYAVLILAFYRLAMFYVAMGTIISFLFIRKYANTTNIFKYVLYLTLLFFIANYFFGEYFKEVNNLFSATIDYFSGKGQDVSADTRFDNQLPILTGMIENNFWTGIGLVEITAMIKFDMFGFVDFPILGTLAAFGIVGMLMYYSKFIILLSTPKIINDTSIINEENPLLLYVYLTLKAYIIVMITFRLFYISWELTFQYMQAEFGLFAGVFLALQKIINEPINENKELLTN